MKAGRHAIADLIPHQGDMCLLDRIIACDREHIVCRAISHRSAAHPLREDGFLPAICGIEYAAQAIAVHGALQGGGRRAGLLAGVRDVKLAVARLDDIADDLIVSAHQLIGDSRGVLYAFALHAGSREIVHGRAAIAFDATEHA